MQGKCYVRQMRGEEFLRSIGSLKRSEMQVGSSFPKTVLKIQKNQKISNKIIQPCEL